MKIISSDFDGTLYRNRIITDRDKNAIRQWQEDGNAFGIVTGRGRDILGTAEEHGIKLNYAIAYNGALVLDEKGEVLYEDWFPRGLAKEYYDFAYSSEFQFAHPYNFTIDENDTSKSYQLELLLKDGSDANALTKLLNEKFEGRLSSYSNGCWINTVKYGTSKATGIEHYAELFGVEREDVYPVGDSFNDLPMLQAFDGYVVSTCSQEMKKLVPNVCDDIAHLTEIANKK